MSGDGQVVVTYISKMGELLRDTAELNKQTAKTLGTLKEQGKEAENVGNIHTRMQAIAKRTFEETRTGAEKSAQKMSELNAAYKRGYLDVDTYERKVRQLNDSQQSGMSSLAGNAARAVGAVVGVGSALSVVSALAGVVRAEYDRFLERHRSAADYGKTEGELKRTLMLNAPLGMSGQQMDSLINKTAAGAGNVDRLAIMRALAPAESVSPNASLDQVAGFVEKAGLLTGGNEQAMSGMARASIGLADKQGWLNDPRKALGFLNAAQMQSMVSNPEQYAKSSAPVFAAANMNKFDLRETAATFGTFTRLGQDDQGSAASTATISLLGQLAELRAPLGLPANASQDQILRALNDPKNAKHKQAFLGKGSKLFKGLHGEEKYIAAQRSMVEGTEAYTDYQAAYAGIPGTESAAAFFDARLAQVNADPSAYIAAISKTGAASAEVDKANKQTQLSGTVIARAEEKLRGLPGGSLFDAGVRAQAEKELHGRIALGHDPVDASTAVLENLAGQYDQSIKAPVDIRGMFGGPSQEDLETANGLRELAEQLKQTRETFRSATEEYKKAVDTFQATKPINGPRPPKQGETP